MNQPKFVFFGTDEFSVKVLETLATKNLKPTLVVTTPDKPRGRKKVITPPPAKTWAQVNDVRFLQPSSLKDSDFFDQLQVAGGEVFLVASYGKIIPPEILNLPAKGVLNIHPSLLSKYRGPSPLESAILGGAAETGVCLMIVDKEMDHGPLLAEKKIALADDYDFEKLRDELAVLGALLFYEALPSYLAGQLEAREQDHAKATYTKKFVKEDGLLNLNEPAIVNYRKILAFNPWPGAFFFDERAGQKIRVLVKKAKIENGELIFERVVPEGRKEMSWTDYQRGRH